MTHYSYPSERLPSIAMLNHTYVPCHFSKSLVVSPPLTPLVSPSISTLHDYKSTPRSKKKPQQRQQHKHVCHFQFCGWSFKRYEHLKRHMLVHTGERPYVCHFPSCGKSFSRSDNFHAHYRTHTKIKNVVRKKKGDTRSSVTVGDDPSSSFSLLANHYKPQQQNILTSNCHVASTVAANAAAAAAVVAVSQQQFGSSNVYYNTNLLDQPHHHSSSEMIDFTRNNHSNTFQNCGMLNFDMQKSSPPISPVSSAASLSLLNHEISPPDSYQPSPSPNPIYAFPYSVQADIQHSTTKKPQASIKSHACPVLQCLRRFKRLEHLKRHMRIHTLERPFACTFPGCQKKFSRSDNLSQHTKTHQKHQEKKRKKKE